MIVLIIQRFVGGKQSFRQETQERLNSMLDHVHSEDPIISVQPSFKYLLGSAGIYTREVQKKSLDEKQVSTVSSHISQHIDADANVSFQCPTFLLSLKYEASILLFFVPRNKDEPTRLCE